jgi:hypothetical protein
MTKLLTAQCEPTRIQGELNNTKYISDYCHGKDAYQSMTIGGHTVTVNSHSKKLYDVITEAQRIADAKQHLVTSHRSPQLPLLVMKVSTGSHREWVETTPKHGFHRIVTEYKEVFDDCLCGKKWLEKHYNDVIPEPTMELSVNGKELHLNGNYKPGMIKDFCKANKMDWE